MVWANATFVALTIRGDIEVISGGNLTCRNEVMKRALEPDECYWIAHEAEIRGRDEIDFDANRACVDRISPRSSSRLHSCFHQPGDIP
jgi:hypothetical protein